MKAQQTEDEHPFLAIVQAIEAAQETVAAQRDANRRWLHELEKCENAIIRQRQGKLIQYYNDMAATRDEIDQNARALKIATLEIGEVAPHHGARQNTLLALIEQNRVSTQADVARMLERIANVLVAAGVEMRTAPAHPKHSLQ